MRKLESVKKNGTPRNTIEYVALQISPIKLSGSGKKILWEINTERNARNLSASRFLKNSG
jgi:hypothetical protein